MTLNKIISGGQTGVDIAALRAARIVGLETGGAMPFGFKTIQGVRPEYVSLYGMTQTVSRGYTERTQKNIRESDGTIIITQSNSPGTMLAVRSALAMNKPFALFKIGPSAAHATLEESVQGHTSAAIQFVSPRSVVNIAGNRDESLESIIGDWLVCVFREVLRRQSH